MPRPTPRGARWRRAAEIATLAALPACVGAPTPLAPNLRGSVGVPHHGVVTDAVALPKKGAGYVLFRDDDVRWGSARLVRAIEQAAMDVAAARPGSPPLVVGDLGQRFGGQTARHRSHRTGRDVDLLLFVTTPRGAAVRSPGFVRFASDGLAEADDGKMFRFDVDRTWLLVRSFLLREDVQWIFVSRPLEALLTEHALALGEPLGLILRAQTVMKQPGDGAPHDDHLHVRLACSRDEAIGGCAGGPRWPWQADTPELHMSEEELVASILGDL